MARRVTPVEVNLAIHVDERFRLLVDDCRGFVEGPDDLVGGVPQERPLDVAEPARPLTMVSLSST